MVRLDVTNPCSVSEAGCPVRRLADLRFQQFGGESIKWNAILGSYYRKKRAEGHPHKWAIVPTMRKLLSLLNRIARDPGFIPMPEPESTKQNANVGRRKKAA